MAVYPACRQTLNHNTETNPVQRGMHFRWCDREWVTLDLLYDDATNCLHYLAIMKEPAWNNTVRFGEDNRWETSEIRRRLREEVLPTLDVTRLAEVFVDMVDESGDETYGTCKDFITLLTADAYRAYRRWMPTYERWIWLATPFSAFPGYAYNVRIVDTSGALGSYLAHNANGLVPGLCAISSFALTNGEIEIIND